MSLRNNWWARLFVERIKELALAYDKFWITREIEDFDKACLLHEEINDVYGMSLDLLKFVEIGRAWLRNQTLPNT